MNPRQIDSRVVGGSERHTALYARECVFVMACSGIVSNRAPKLMLPEPRPRAFAECLRQTVLADMVQAGHEKLPVLRRLSVELRVITQSKPVADREIPYAAGAINTRGVHLVRNYARTGEALIVCPRIARACMRDIPLIGCSAPRSVTSCTPTGRPIKAASGKPARDDRHVAFDTGTQAPVDVEPLRDQHPPERVVGTVDIANATPVQAKGSTGLTPR